jgi:phage related tail fiber protein
MQETTNLKLRKPEYNEYADIADINHNMDILDEEVNKKLDKTKKAADSEKLDGLDSLMFARSYSLFNNDKIPKDVFNNTTHNQSYMGVIDYGTEVGLPKNFAKIVYIPHATDGYGTQVAIPYDSGLMYGMYYRNSFQNSWKPWLELLDTRERNATDPTTIAPNNNANNCQDTGKAYYCIWKQTANLPFGTVDDGIIIPYMHHKGQFGFQIYMTWNGTSIWWRKIHSGNWSKWHCIGGGSWNQEIQKDSEQVGKYLRWGAYGQNHVIFDASTSIRPDGQPCDRTNSNQPWTASNCPTLMGFNGDATWGVRVDSARNSDQVRGFQFRNNNGILEVLINGVWMAVGGQIYNRQRFKRFQSWLSETNYMQGHEDQIITIFDIQKPCKIVDFNFNNFVWTYGNTTDTTIPKLYAKEYKIYIDDILAKHIRIDTNTSTELTEGTETYISKSAQLFKTLIGELQANRRLRIDVTVGVNPRMYFTGWINILYHN